MVHKVKLLQNSPLIDLVNDTILGYLSSYNNKLYLLDKNYKLSFYDGSVFSNVIPFTIGDTGGGGKVWSQERPN